MRILDLYSCAGGAAVGYQRAGFDVVGVDITDQPNYPYPHARLDAVLALTWLHGGRKIRAGGQLYGLDDFDAVHASPPCQNASALTAGNRKRDGWTDTHIDLIEPTRALLDRIGKPYVIENVQGSGLRRDLTLCGEMFGLAVLRHRYFELGGWTMPALPHVPHRGRVAGMRHGVWYEGPYFAVYGEGGGKGTVKQWQEAMGIDWTDDRREIAEAIPPAYTESVGTGLMDHLVKAAATLTV